ncbi:MAG: TAXI family TRAP transporter solute-binding subunit [Leptothrix ochracea]|uniref:TAXI family TRAP transporter solute-binding subunit n=1 Tax=Leptothrix ochracea TaxID=735331 RepID=UPI0034E1B063
MPTSHHPRSRMQQSRWQLALAGARDLVINSLPLILVGAVLVALAYYVIDPAPPPVVTISTSPKDSTYWKVCQKYKAFVEKHHDIQVTCQESGGSVDNVRQLLGHQATAAFVGYLPESERLHPDIKSLGLLFRQPLWIFYRRDVARQKGLPQDLTRLTQLQGWQINVGKEGSGGRALFLEMLKLNDIALTPTPENQRSPTEAMQALIDKTVEAIVFEGVSDMVNPALFHDPNIGLMELKHAMAYDQLLPNIDAITLPMGAVDQSATIPAQDTHMIGTQASLVVHASAHPALQSLLMMAAREIHGEASWVQNEGEFPIGKPGWFALSTEAERFHRQGFTLKERKLPFWLVNFFERMWMALVTILALMVPLSRIVPTLYTFRIRSGIFQWYAALREIEDELVQRSRDGEIAWTDLRQRLREIEDQVRRIQVPLSHAHDLYALRSHITLVGQRIDSAATSDHRPFMLSTMNAPL